jgi:hypothetical protein
MKAVIHEYMHSFCEIPALVAYINDEQFQKWVAGTKPTYQGYDDSLTIAIEYMVRAHVMLYYAENGYSKEIPELIESEKTEGFIYIEEVYNMLKKDTGK